MKRESRAGVALVIVLCAVVLATVMVVAIMVGARLERQSAFYHEERVRADALAQTGVDHAIALLRCGMTGATGTGGSWISGPGLIIPVTSGTQGQPIPLSSGSANTALTGIYQAPNLNAALLGGTASCPIDPTGAAMPVKWIYVRTNGTLDLSNTPQYSSTNPLIGRYAFWVDDNSSRINLNTAWTRNAENTNSPGNISRINLSSIANFPFDEAHTLSGAHFFNSDSDLREPDLVTAVNANRYAFTFYNHSIDGLNPFGKPKIYLTTQPAYLPAGLVASGLVNLGGTNSNYFLDIIAPQLLTSGSYVDPGIVSNLSDAKIDQTVNYLVSYLTNTNWPEYPGMSFAHKFWGSDSDPRIFQLAVNIIEYIRAKESQQKVLTAIRGYVANGAFTSTTVSDAWGSDVFPSGQSYPLIGTTRTPVITEVSLYYLLYWNPCLAIQTELYLPPNVGIDVLSGTDIAMEQQYEYSNSFITSADRWWPIKYAGPPSVASPAGQGYFFAIAPSTFPLTSANPYAEVATEEQSKVTGGDWNFTGPGGSFLNGTFYCWVGISPASSPYALSFSASSDYFGTTPGNSRGIGPFNLTAANQSPLANSYQIDDPLTGMIQANWQWKPSTWGAPNTGTLTAGQSAGPYQPQQDTTLLGFVTNVGWRLPYPYGYVTVSGSTPNASGRMDSLSELGYVNTGAVGWTNTNTNANTPNGVPWRTLRLQPSTNSQTLPDWALLDLFALPPTVTATNYVAQPYAWTAITPGAMGGRMNLNALLRPFTTSTNRITPLLAMLTGAINPVTGAAFPNSPRVVGNIQNMTMASGGTLYDSTNGMYAHVGELADISGIADTGEASEANLFEPLAQTTISGNVFSVYAVGQALQQLSSGSFAVNGEKKIQATVERVLNVAPMTTGTNGFRIVIVRDLRP